MEWKAPSLHRHLSTIGIGPVFICPPPHSLPPEPVEDNHETSRNETDRVDESTGELTDTWEIIGDIKSCPQDFVVREIGWAPSNLSSDGDVKGCSNIQPTYKGTNRYSRLPGWSRRIAGFECHSLVEEVSNDSSMTHSEVAKQGSTLSSDIDYNGDDAVQSSIKKSKREETDLSKQNQSHLDARTKDSSTDAQSIKDVSYVDEKPMDGLTRILMICHSSVANESNDHQSPSQKMAASDTLQQLAELQESAIQAIQSCALSTNHIDIGTVNLTSVWIPTMRIARNELDTKGHRDWKLLHKYIRMSFSLLRTEASSLGPTGNTSQVNKSVGHSKPIDKSWIRVEIDKMYFPIAPLLANPVEDLSALYKFRNNGPVATSNRGRNDNRARYNNHSKRNKDQIHNESEADIMTGNQVLLRLRLDLPRSERRIIHQALTSSRRRDFDTSTIHDVPINESEKTTAIVVQWSRNSLQGLQKKRKRNDGNISASDVSAIFCVLRKEQCEHQVAINQISRALKCRVGDIGLAGIKDMQAVTYQFCTIRNADLKRVKRVHELLDNRVQLSHFVHVQGSNALLDRGKLLGSKSIEMLLYVRYLYFTKKLTSYLDHFEITIKNMRRVQRLQAEGEISWRDRTTRLNVSHFDAMVKRISNFGFINFYGEQRVGDAGFQSHVGVRSFDVGKAMLKEDFSAAIDLIMTGRSSQVYSPSAEEVEARCVWKNTKDARQTLTCFPKNTSTMTRERDLMRGMLRYDNALEAIRCVPYNVRMFWIHAYQVRSMLVMFMNYNTYHIASANPIFGSRSCGIWLQLKE